MLAVVGHLGVPHQAAGQAIDGDDVSVVGDHEDLVAQDRHAAVGAGAGVAHHACGAGTLVAPDLTAMQRVDGMHFVDGADVHHAVDDHGR